MGELVIRTKRFGPKTLLWGESVQCATGMRRWENRGEGGGIEDRAHFPNYKYFTHLAFGTVSPNVTPGKLWQGGAESTAHI